MKLSYSLSLLLAFSTSVIAADMGGDRVMAAPAVGTDPDPCGDKHEAFVECLDPNGIDGDVAIEAEEALDMCLTDGFNSIAAAAADELDPDGSPIYVCPLVCDVVVNLCLRENITDTGPTCYTQKINLIECRVQEVEPDCFCEPDPCGAEHEAFAACLDPNGIDGDVAIKADEALGMCLDDGFNSPATAAAAAAVDQLDPDGSPIDVFCPLVCDAVVNPCLRETLTAVGPTCSDQLVTLTDCRVQEDQPVVMDGCICKLPTITPPRGLGLVARVLKKNLRA